MLKHRYDNISESVSDFNRMLDGMNKTQPLEKAFSNDLHDLFCDEQELIRYEQQIEHIHRISSGSGQEISEVEARDIVKMHENAAAMYTQAAQKAGHRMEAAQRAHSPGVAAKLREARDHFLAKAKEHKAEAAKYAENLSMVSESVQSKRPAVMQRFRLLAGIDVDVQMPRDPGVFGTTRFNEGYADMAKPFTEAKGETADHDKRMKADAKKIKAAADDVEKEHEDGKKEESKWAGAAVKHPGRLHKYFGIPDGQKIPMSKIKGAYEKLKDKKDKSAEEASLMRALALGVRFKGGDVPGGEKKKGLAGD